MAEVVTRGSGEHELVADQVELRVTYSADGADRSGAVNLLSTRVAGVDAMLRDEPVAGAVEVRQRNMYVGDRWERNRRVGATAQLSLLLRSTRLEVLDDVVAGLLSAEPQNLDGPYWSLADESAAMREAQRHAVADARARAEAYAAAAGRRLGPLLRLSDEGSEQPYPMTREVFTMAGADAGVSRQAVQQLGLRPVPITVRTTCTATWALLD